MEALIAALSGWITTEDIVLNLQTGLRIVNQTEDEANPTAEIFFPDGTSEVFEGPDAIVIFDRAEALAAAGGFMLAQLNTMTGYQPEGATTE